jgi:nucleolar protein 9
MQLATFQVRLHCSPTNSILNQLITTMPKELVRKRGRRAKKGDKEEYPLPAAAPEPVIDLVPEFEAGPSSQPYQGDGAPSRFPDGKDPAAPFGYVDPDIKAYFKSVDEKLREWEEIGLAPGEGEESELEGR